ncbi:MAG: hypothetical protein LBV68_02270 [Spirochaetaceae bacterium]|jgi:hypothetical protein|nr:hypothetical protein [Spirochaetaceae bacterium]
MADKLDWQNKHIVLLRYVTVSGAVEKENFKIRPDIAELYEGTLNAEHMAFKLAEQGKHKDACELLAYVCHRRAGVWWGYQCVNSLIEELRINPAVERDIADIAKDFNVEVPDFAKINEAGPSPDDLKIFDNTLQKIRAQKEVMRSLVNPEVLSVVEEAQEFVYQEFAKVHGIDPMALLQQLGQRLKESYHQYDLDPQSPLFVEAEKLKAQLGAVQKETSDLIKSVLPPKIPAHEKKMRDETLDAVYRWVNAPDDLNSKACLDMGNECPGTPAGLLALSAFWAYGNLMPGGDQVVPTPSGLAANGLTQVFLMCALHKGGTRKAKERFELYFNKGLDVLTGKDNWEETLVEDKAPHERELPDTGVNVRLVEQDHKQETDKPNTAETPSKVSYKRWKME